MGFRGCCGTSKLVPFPVMPPSSILSSLYIFHHAKFSEGADGDLAASAQTVQKSAFARGGGAGSGIVEKGKEFARRGVAIADFDGERSLSGGRAHDLGRDDVLDQLGFAQAVQAGRGEDNGVVFFVFELAQARVDIAAQRVNVEIGSDRPELRLAAQAGRADTRAAG